MINPDYTIVIRISSGDTILSNVYHHPNVYQIFTSKNPSYPAGYYPTMS